LNNAKVAGESHLVVKAADAIQNAPEPNPLFYSSM
jgi:hypothetical protein